MAEPISLYLAIRIALFTLAVLIGAVAIFTSHPHKATEADQ